MCAGNYTNQEVAFERQVVESINTILEHSFVLHLTPPAPELHVGASAIELLEIMLEIKHQGKSQSPAKGISDDLNVRALLSAMLKLAMSDYKVQLAILYIY